MGNKKVTNCGNCEFSKSNDKGAYDCTTICEKGFREPYRYLDPWDICTPPSSCPYSNGK